MSTEPPRTLDPRSPSRTPAMTAAWSMWVGVIGALALVVALSFSAHQIAYFPIDLGVTRALQSFQTPALDAFATGVDWIGYLPQFVVIVGLIAVTFWIAGWRREAFAIVMAEVSEGIVNNAVKWLVVRPRPDPSLVKVYLPLQDYTFPSGHAFSFLVVFGLLSIILIERLRPSTTRTVIVVILVALIVIVGPVRSYLGAHWPSDVLAGYLLGAVDLFVLAVWYRRGKEARQALAGAPGVHSD